MDPAAPNEEQPLDLNLDWAPTQHPAANDTPTPDIDLRLVAGLIPA